MSGKFSPIVWDTVAYYWKNTRSLDLGTNSLFRSVLEIPGLREKKDRFLWNAINGDLSTENVQTLIWDEAAKIQPDVEAFALKLHASDKGVETYLK